MNVKMNGGCQWCKLLNQVDDDKYIHGMKIESALINLLQTPTSSEKWKWGDQKAVVQQQTAQWFPGQGPMEESPPRKESAGQVTPLSPFPRETLAGRARYVA